MTEDSQVHDQPSIIEYGVPGTLVSPEPRNPGFLLALARQHLGRPAEARRDCDRALERLRTNNAEDETRDVAIEALMTTRGLSQSKAESLLLDAAFPANSFAP